jgi:FkbM family methyltransferase
MIKLFTKKLKAIYRIIRPINITTDRYYENSLKLLPKFKSLEQTAGIYVVDFDFGIKIGLRNKNHSDLDVFRQIFILEEYDVISSLIKLNNSKLVINIIDAGANVGYTSLYFSTKIPNCRMFSIEPSRENFQLLKFNIETNSANAKLYNCALAEVGGKKFDISRDFRDSKDWSVTTTEKSDGNIDGITVNEIIVDNKLNYISLLKIDIEGAERFVFRDGLDLSYLRITQYIAIEIHDEFGIRDNINDILRDHGFILLQTGELTIGINTRALELGDQVFS